VRLKRPSRARVNDASLGFDPYRTWAGMSQTRYSLLVLCIVFGVIGIIAAGGILIAFFAASQGGR
jgi:hypothetical protein